MAVKKPGESLLLVGQMLAHLDYLDEAIGTLNRRLEEVLAPFAESVARLDTIRGINRRTAEVLIAELGLDMSVFPTAAHVASWAGGCAPATTRAPANTNRARLERGPACCAPS